MDPQTFIYSIAISYKSESTDYYLIHELITSPKELSLDELEIIGKEVSQNCLCEEFAYCWVIEASYKLVKQ